MKATDINVPGGAAKIRAVYQLADGRSTELPVLVAFHGGGRMFGDLHTAQWLWSEVAARVPAVVVAGTYRLAPENPAPAALKDAFGVTASAVEHAASSGAELIASPCWGSAPAAHWPPRSPCGLVTQRRSRCTSRRSSTPSPI